MKTIHVFTSAACNYIPKVRVLFESIRKFHPEWRIHLALSDEISSEIDLASEPFDEIHSASSLDIPHFYGWAFCHNIVELSTAIKPFMLNQLINREGCAGVIYLDPDIALFSPLTEIVTALEKASIALTPHLTAPESTLAAVMDNEISCLKHGIYNLGFVAVSPTEEGKKFASWWAERLYYFCRDEKINGLFTDQKWIDLAPALFEGVSILRTPRLNVAPWNLTTRFLSGHSPDEILVNNERLGFYHFTGFDSGAHHIMSVKNSKENKTVADLVKWYIEKTAHISEDPLSNIPWQYATYSDGSKIPKEARLIYRHRKDLQLAFPDPFNAKKHGRTYLAWWKERAHIEYPEIFTNDDLATIYKLIEIQYHLTPGYTPEI